MNRLTKLAGIVLLAGAAALTTGCGKAVEEPAGPDLVQLARMNIFEQYVDEEKLNVQLGKAKAVQIMDFMSDLENLSDNENWRTTEHAFSYNWGTIGRPLEQGGSEGGLWSNDIKVTYSDFGEVGPSQGDLLRFEQDVFLGKWHHTPEGEYSRSKGDLYMKNKISIGIGKEDLYCDINHYTADFQNNYLLTETLKSLKK